MPLGEAPIPPPLFLVAGDYRLLFPMACLSVRRRFRDVVDGCGVDFHEEEGEEEGMLGEGSQR